MRAFRFKHYGLGARTYLTVVYMFFMATSIFSQNQKLADSLALIYAGQDFQENDRIGILHQLAVNHTNPDEKQKYSLELIALAQALDSLEYIMQGFVEKGNAHRLKGELNKALEVYFQAAQIASEQEWDQAVGTIFVAVADIYSFMGNYSNALNYYKSSIEILRLQNDSINVASALLNAGDLNTKQGKLDSALIYFAESGAIFKQLHSKIGVAYTLGNVGLVYAKMGRNEVAVTNINQAVSLLEELGDFYPICVYYTAMSDVYFDKEDFSIARDYAERSLDLAKRYGLRNQISEANLKLSELHQKNGNMGKAYVYYIDHIIYRDSVKNIESVQQMADLRTNFEVSQKQIEVDLLNQQRKNQRIIAIATVVALFLIALLALGLYRRNKFIQKTNRIIEKERNRSDNLLLNILPKETAEELKENGKVLAKKFESVTILFTDFEKFTKHSENLTPEELVKSVDFYFSKFDDIIGKYDLEKIKTVGDAYMCAGGLPFSSKDHALRMVHAAIEIVDFVNEVDKSELKLGPRFKIRVGINTGPVVAGVVGTKKFAYDIWGDAVNIASRMESNSEPGQINISENTFRLVKDSFNCTYRGEIGMKNRGEMKMYFVDDAIEPVLS